MQRTVCKFGCGFSASAHRACAHSCLRSCAGAAGWRLHYSWATPVLDEVQNTSIFKTGRPDRYRRPIPCLPPSPVRGTLRESIAQRFSALAHLAFFTLLAMAASGRSRQSPFGAAPAPGGVALYLAAQRPLDRARVRSRPILVTIAPPRTSASQVSLCRG